MPWPIQLTVLGFVALQEQVHAQPCLHHPCGQWMDVSELAHCLTQINHDHWACHRDEHCEVWTEGRKVFMECIDAHHELDECWQDHYRNPAGCTLNPNNISSSNSLLECSYCTADTHSINYLVTGSSTHASNTPHNPPDACYSANCGHLHGMDLVKCVDSGSFGCGANQFCKIDVHHGNGDVHMKCVDRAHLDHCLEGETHQSGQCSPLTYPPPQDCHFCCEDRACFEDRFSIATTAANATAAATTPTQQQPATHAPHNPLNPPDACYSAFCGHLHGMDLVKCVASGSFGCGANQYCKIDVHHGNGDIHMRCEDRAHLNHCLDEEFHQSWQCSPLTFPPPQDCHFCCEDRACFEDRFSITTTAASVTTTTATTTTTTAATAAPTTPTQQQPTTHAPTTSAPTTHTTQPATTPTTTPRPCVDLYSGDCAVDFAGQCSDHTVQIVCPKFCGVCQPPCMDLYLGDCSVDFAGQCGDHTVADVCPKTCKRCHPWECKDHYNGPSNCSVTFPGQCSNPVIAMVCQNTCGKCVHSTVPPPTTASCVQCGDYNSQKPCSNMELLMDTVSLCQDPSAKFCMTDVNVDSAGVVSTYKRCVGNVVCANEWYLQTSDKHVCLAFDPMGSPHNLACHYCCVSSGCNTNTVPSHTTWWRP